MYKKEERCSSFCFEKIKSFWAKPHKIYLCGLLTTRLQCLYRQTFQIFIHFSLLPELTVQTRFYAHSRYLHHSDIFLPIPP